MKTRVYEYGLRQPTVGADVVFDQLRRAHQYYNKLIEIERQRRLEFRQLESHFPAVAELGAQLDALNQRIEASLTRIQESRQKHRANKFASADVVDVKVAKAERKSLSARLKTAKVEVRENEWLKGEALKVDEKAKRLAREARAASGVYWGTYQSVDAAVDAARKSKADPRFKRWSGHGAVSVHCQDGGLAAADIFGADNAVQIMPVDPRAWSPETRRGDRRRLARTVLRLRVGAKDAPSWAEWPMVMHRPLPPGSVVRWVRVVMDTHCMYPHWRAQITVDIPDAAAAKAAPSGVVAVDIGWRAVGDEIRVAYWVGDDGRSGELRLPTRTLRRRKKNRHMELHLNKSEALRSFRDKTLDEFRAGFAAALAELTLPETFAPRVEFVAKWRACERFHRLLSAWRADRFAGDDAAFALLDAWARRDLHLWRYEDGLRRHAMGHRRELYRLFACQLAKHYGTVIFEDWNLAAFARRAAVEDGTRDARKPNRQRVDAALSLLRTTIVHTGVQVLKVDPAYTTMLHASCGTTNTDDFARNVEHTCAGCGVVFDQDWNAAVNLLASGQATLKKAGALAGDKPAETKKAGKWSRRKRAVEVEPPTPSA